MNNTTIGLPKALLYYRYGTLWESFFKNLGLRITHSEDTNEKTMEIGISKSVSECCLPLKAFLGHVHNLIGNCDYIFVPRFSKTQKEEEFCIRFWGLPDIVQNTFPDARIISYNLDGTKAGAEKQAFLQLGEELGFSTRVTASAYNKAKMAQKLKDERDKELQDKLLRSNGTKVLIVSHPYVIHDPYIGAPLVQMVDEQNVLPLFSDYCDHSACLIWSKELSSDLFWTMNKEEIGAIPLLSPFIDGIILVSAFPCGTDSLINELVLRRVNDIPITNIVLDEQQGEAGLQTRIECFLDIIKERRKIHAS